MDFARAIAPVSVDDFFATYFEKKHLVIRRDTPNYYVDLLNIHDIDRVMTQNMLTTDDLNLVNNGTGIDFSDFSVSSGHIDPARVAQQFAQGSTIILPQLQRYLPKLAAYCRALETVFSCDLQTNIYFTPDNAQGFKTHYDSHDVIVLQVHGTKTWRIYESPLELPLRSQAFEPEGFVPGKVIDEFVLKPGDMLYCPRGVVHDAIATDEMSLHITTGLLTPRWVDMLVSAITQAAHKDVELRRAVPPGFANHGFDRAEARQTFQDLLARVGASLDADATLDTYADDFRRRRVPVVPGQFLQAIGAEGIEPGSEVGVREGLIYDLALRSGEDGDEIVLSVYDNEITFPAFCEEPLRDALSRAAVRVGDLAGELDDDGQAVMIRRLVREGVMVQLA